MIQYMTFLHCRQLEGSRKWWGALLSRTLCGGGWNVSLACRFRQQHILEVSIEMALQRLRDVGKRWSSSAVLHGATPAGA